MKEENAKIQMRKGIMEYCVLAILANGDEYAPAIIAELKSAEMIVVEEIGRASCRERVFTFV